MKFRSFGKTGWQVSEIGFGAWAIGGGAWVNNEDFQSTAALHRALELGVTFIDTAQGYGNGHSERLIAQVMQERGLRRGGGPVKVATKIPPSDGAWPPLPDDRSDQRYPEKYLREKVEERLKILQAEALDVLQLHTWTRAWNRDPGPLLTLQKLKKEGKILAVGVSTPEQDQNSLVDPMRHGLLDAVQVIYNIFEQEPRAEFLPTAQQNGVGVIVRVVFDEGSLTGKFKADTKFAEGDFRRRYFRGERLAETVQRVEAIRQTVLQVSNGAEKDLPSVAIRFALKHPAVSTVITGIRNLAQAEQNLKASDQPPLSDELYNALKKHYWRRAIWYS